MAQKKPKEKQEVKNRNGSGSGSDTPGKSDKQPDALDNYRRIRRQLQMVLLLAIAGVVACSSSYNFVFPHPFFQNYASTDGLVMRSAIVRNRRLQFPQSITSQPQLTYQYTVNGRTYENTESGVASTDLKLASDVVGKHPQGSSISVKYATNDPQSSYLTLEDSKPPLPVVALFILGALALIVSIVLLLRLSVKLRKAKR